MQKMKFPLLANSTTQRGKGLLHPVQLTLLLPMRNQNGPHPFHRTPDHEACRGPMYRMSVPLLRLRRAESPSYHDQHAADTSIGSGAARQIPKTIRIEVAFPPTLAKICRWNRVGVTNATAQKALNNA